MPQTISNEKLQANRENAKHSTGPRTDAGKRRSSQNALKHGLLAQQAVLPDEDPHEYDNHIRTLEQNLQPADFVEFSLIRQIVDAEWRLRRLTRIETAITLRAVAQRRSYQASIAEYNNDPPGYPPNLNPESIEEFQETELFGAAMAGEARTIDTYGRYGARLLRQFHDATSKLDQRQKNRAAKPPQQNLHRRPPQTESGYAPPPPADPLPTDPLAAAIDTDAPVTLDQSLHPLVRSRLRGDPDRLNLNRTPHISERAKPPLGDCHLFSPEQGPSRRPANPSEKGLTVTDAPAVTDPHGPQNTKQTQPSPTQTNKITYQHDEAQPRTPVSSPDPDRGPPDS